MKPDLLLSLALVLPAFWMMLGQRRPRRMTDDEVRVRFPAIAERRMWQQHFH